MTADYGSLPFEEAIDYFRQKVDMPSERWEDMLAGQHARAFTVAGATKDGMLADFRVAIDQAIADGTTLETFRAHFDDIVQKYGWSYKGTRGWRSRVIYETNLRTAYAAGRWRQTTDPDVLRYRPYWQYVHSDAVKHPRPEHLAWDGLVLPADDPWWRTHTPPNGWGCQCGWEALSRRDLAAAGKSGPDRAPPIDARAMTLQTSYGPVDVQVPKGVDPGWGYSVGETAFGRILPDAEMRGWRDMKSDAWESLTPGDWRDATWRDKPLPARLPADAPKAKLGPKAKDRDELAKWIEAAIGGSQMALAIPDGTTILIDAASLADHMDLARAPFVPFLAELLSDPAEIWARFDQHKGTGRVVLRKRLVKVLDIPGQRGMVLTLDAAGGVFGGWTLVPVGNLNYLDKQRVGRLLWARD